MPEEGEGKGSEHQLTLSQKEGADYACNITTRPPDFQTSDIPTLDFKLHNLINFVPSISIKERLLLLLHYKTNQININAI